MSLSCRHWPRFAARALLLALACHGGVCCATLHALLVGVTSYPALGPALQLQAPANDVQLIRQVLQQRGFEAQRIEVLADGVDGARLPTRDAIISSLQALRARVKPGDTVYVHFAGHGSIEQIPEGEAVPSGAPRWRPVFLPRDVSGWDGRSEGHVRNAIADAALRAEFDRLNDAGAFVFGVFDACHSARLVRGATPAGDPAAMRPRYVAPQALGIDEPLPADLAPVWASRAPAAPETDRRRGRAVYFYAAQSIETADSLPLAAGGRTQWHGVLGWHVAQALALGQPMSYRQLAQHLLSRYDQMPATTASPLFGGDGLDQRVFGQESVAVRQWPLQRGDGQIAIAAGALAGLAEGALFALVADPLAPAPDDPLRPPQGTLGFVRLTRLEAGRSVLEPVAWQQWAAPVPQALSPGAWARLIVNPPSFALRVAVDRSACSDRCAGGLAIARLRRDGVAGVDVKWVGNDEAADVGLQASARGVRMLLPGEAEVWGYAPQDADEGAERLAGQVAGALHRVARTRNLLQLAARMALRPHPADLTLNIEAVRPSSRAASPVVVDRLSRVAPGDLLTLQGLNALDDPLDVAIFWLGADQSIRRVYPFDVRDTPRLAAHEALRRFGLRIDAGSAGVERILVLTMPIARGHEASDFRFLEQSPLARLRGAADPDLQALMDACFADYRTRGTAAPALPPDRLGMRVYTLAIDP